MKKMAVVKDPVLRFLSHLRGKEDICRDIIQKLKETGQVYIVEHDYPISVSRFIFKALDEKRRKRARELGVPEVQYEFEDLFAHFIGKNPETIPVMRRVAGKIVKGEMKIARG